jgi:hypothetical protein
MARTSSRGWFADLQEDWGLEDENKTKRSRSKGKKGGRSSRKKSN